ncbi:hypothetical protein GPECTOR_55g298 [Gonium pectorale]|uniref:Uncharacterized protein n=1 Tax=Gonium pectorale TaxID=33097 RepID=A0A150G6C0_GONPE|nr:hypothetical protein GPECTOR_55g298 [Gonium pectorale]|eukprot:KXZ45392.1 hypothetical protein GPECTOR_55g298 [Gonium pectorale]
MDREASASATSPTTFQRPTLRNLDLRSIQPEDSVPSETQLRRQKFLFFEKHCSEVSPGLFLSGDYVAKSRETLQQAGVTHVLNCVGFICKEYFKDELTYKTLYLQDTPAEDISCVLYDCLDYIESALSSGGRILVHCSQGVSRSATLVIAYMMWRSGKPYDEVFAAVKGVRGVANPNIGFTCQLLQWQKRAATARSRLRLYRIAPHCVHAPTYLVPKLITPPKQYPNNTHRDLDPRGAFVLQTPSGGPTYVWRGEACPEPFAEAAHRAAQQLCKFEGAGPVVEVRQGQEPASLLKLLDPAPLDAEAARLNARRSSITGEIELLSAREHGAGGAGGGGGLGSLPQSGSHQAVAGADMDVDSDPSTSGAGWASGAAAMDLSTPRPGAADREAASGIAGFPSGSALLEEVACVRTGDSGVYHWTPKDVDEYTDDYMLYYHTLNPKAAASGGAYDGSMRASYDTAGTSITASGMMAPAMAGPQVDLLMSQAGRPDSPANKEGHRKKFRKADSERPKLGLWTAAMSDGHGPELARTHNVSSLHESVDEDLLCLPPAASR